MRLYLDEDSVNHLFVQLLRNAGHDVEIPKEARLSGEPDPVHLTHSISEQRVFLTKNYGDFEYLHNLIMAAHGHHPGIRVVRQDNDPKRDMTSRVIVRALGKLELAGVTLPDGFHILNQWR